MFSACSKGHMPSKGNPGWGKFSPTGTATPTEFELQAQLRLSPESYALSHELREWCRTNRNRGNSITGRIPHAGKS